MNEQLQRIEGALDELPEALTIQIRANVSPPYSFIPASQANKLCKIMNNNPEQLGLALLPLATAFAVAPISGFHVGAIAFDSANNIYLGANFEFASTHIGQTVHAEQSAITHAWARGAQDLDLLVVNYPPCGHCRQFINETRLSKNFRILLPETPAAPLASFLPKAFGPEDLQIKQRILGNSKITTVTDNLWECATHACEKSHAPYSHSYSGIALQFDDGEIVTGCYAENAAFNPSLPPLQMALNTRRLQCQNWRTINQVVLVEREASLSQKENTIMLLQAISPSVQTHYRMIESFDDLSGDVSF